MTDLTNSIFSKTKGRLTCPNCGAPITNDICEYCGAVLVDVACINMNRPTLLKVIDENGIVRMFNCKINRYWEECETNNLWADNNIVLALRQPEIHMVFDIL